MGASCFKSEGESVAVKPRHQRIQHKPKIAAKRAEIKANLPHVKIEADDKKEALEKIVKAKLEAKVQRAAESPKVKDEMKPKKVDMVSIVKQKLGMLEETPDRKSTL